MLIKKMLFTYLDTQCLYVVTNLNIADHLKDAPKSASELAMLTQTKPNKLLRIMRYLSSKDLFELLPDKRFSLNKNSSYLVSSNPENINNFIRLHAIYFYPAATKLLDSMQVDAAAFELEFGSIAGNYFRENPTAKEIYNNAMQENSELYGRLIAEIYNFSNYKTIVDVGGGIGSLLAHILLKEKSASGINYDLPGLQKKSEKYFKDHGLTSKVNYIGGDFNLSIPSGGDLYMMKAILHAREDKSAITLLNKCKNVLADQGKLLVIERVIAGAGEDSATACVNDINMLNVSSGKVRTLNEFKTLFKSAGFAIKEIYPVANAIAIFELVVPPRI